VVLGVVQPSLRIHVRVAITAALFSAGFLYQRAWKACVGGAERTYRTGLDLAGFVCVALVVSWVLLSKWFESSCKSLKAIVQQDI